MAKQRKASGNIYNAIKDPHIYSVQASDPEFRCYAPRRGMLHNPAWLRLAERKAAIDPDSNRDNRWQ